MKQFDPYCQLIWILAVILSSSTCHADYRVTTTDAAPPKGIADAIRPLLDAKAITISHGDAMLMELWLRAELPSAADADQVKNGLTLREIPETTLLGVVRFPKVFTDYRKQEIPTGVYTLRLAFQPETGDHKETAPHAEFALLVPIADDATLDTMDAKELYALSRKASGGDHPAVMMIAPAKKAKAEPAIVDRGGGTMTLDLLRAVTANRQTVNLGLGFTIAGWSKTR